MAFGDLSVSEFVNDFASGAIVVVAVVASVLLLRRRGGGPAITTIPQEGTLESPPESVPASE